MSSRGPKSRQAIIDLIDTDGIVRRLGQAALGENEVTGESLRAADILLRRSLPEVRMTESKLEHTFDGNPASITNEQLLEIIAGDSGQDATGEKDSQD